MTIPTSPTWNLADFSGEALGQMLGLPDGDLTALPSIAPYFTYNNDLSVLHVKSSAGVEGSLSFDVGLPSRFTLDVVLRCPQLPHNLGDLALRRFGLTVADDAGRGFSLYLAKTGVAISGVENFGAVTALPDTSDVTQAVSTTYHTLRIAVDSGLGRAFVFVGQGQTSTPPLRWIIPVETSPANSADLFRLFAKGLPNEPVAVEIISLRLAGDLVVANYPPVADAGPDRVATSGNAVRFDGRASYDVEGVPLTYRWSCIDAPYGSQFAADTSTATAVDDGDADGVTSFVSVSPFAVPAWLQAGDLVRLQDEIYEVFTVNAGTGLIELTSDSLPDSISNEAARFIRQSVLLDRTSPTPVAVPDLPGLYRFRLVVNDGDNDSEPVEVLASISALPTPVGIEPNVSIIWKAIGDEWHLVEGRNLFEEMWIGVAQVLSGKLMEAWQHHYNTSIRDAQKVFQRKWIAYRTFLPEGAPDSAVLSARFGGFTATHQFEVEEAPLQGLDLRVEVLQPSGSWRSITVSFEGVDLGSPASLAAKINATLATAGAQGVEAHTSSSRELRREGQGRSDDGTGLDPGTFGISAPVIITDVQASAGDSLSFAGRRWTVRHAGDYGILLEEYAQLRPSLPQQRLVVHRAMRLSLRGTTPFKLNGPAADALGFPVNKLNDLGGGNGARVTDRVYFVEGVDLLKQEVKRGDLLVLNNGESFSVDRVLDDPFDALPNQRVVLFDQTPIDSTSTWSIPSVLRSSETDYELAGAYPGDLAKIEIYTEATGAIENGKAYVEAQKGTQLAVRFSEPLHAARLANKELRFIGLKRRKAIPLPKDVLSIPGLQELIAQKLNPARYREHVDYVLEPFYRDTGGRPIAMLQFANSVFIEPDAEPADVLWAETTLFDNQGQVENLFGRLVGFLRDDAATFSKDFNYISGVAGLLYAQQSGPRLFAMNVGAQILLGQPFAEVAGYIEEIRANYSPRQGRVLIRDDDGNKPTESDTVRAYYYTKVPSDTSPTSGLAINPLTGIPWTTGEQVPQFAQIGAGIDIVDIYKDPKWWSSYVGSGAMYEVEKFHRFVCTFDLDVVDLANIGLLFSLLSRVKPTYTRPFLVGAHSIQDDVDITDAAEMQVRIEPHETLLAGGIEYNGSRYDDYRGDGITSCLYDDGVSRYDALVDAPLDLISFEATIEWPGGQLNFPTVWPFRVNTQAVDIDGNQTGTPGTSFTITSGMSLAAGHYRTLLAIKDGPVLPA